MRLGYFPNVTHAPALVGVEDGVFEEALGENTLETSRPSTPVPTRSTALLRRRARHRLHRPEPGVNAYVQSNGEAVRVIVGRDVGRRVPRREARHHEADGPQGQEARDAAARQHPGRRAARVAEEAGLRPTPRAAATCQIVPQDNALTLDAFKEGQIDGAWVPEPWATRLINEGGGKVLVDERDLWPDGKYVTTNLIVRTEFLEEHPDVVKRLLTGHLDAIDFIKTEPRQGRGGRGRTHRERHRQADRRGARDGVVRQPQFTARPDRRRRSQQSAKDAGRSASSARSSSRRLDLEALYDLKALNKVLKKNGQPTDRQQP